MLALLKDNAIILEVQEGAPFSLPDGRHVSSATAGWYSIVPSTFTPTEENPEPPLIDPDETRDGYELVSIAEADPVPSGKKVASTSIDLSSGTPKYVHVLEDLTPEEHWAPVRAQRDALLAACDWTQLADSPLAAGPKADWATYRQALRNLPKTQTDPDNIVWPTAPAA